MKKCIMIIVSFASLLTTQITTHAQNIECTLLDKPESSSMKITYRDGAPDEIYLRSPNSDHFRKQNVAIKSTVQLGDQGNESFSASPVIPSSIVNWEVEPYCYKKVGTQWFFNFFHNRSSYYVFFMPYYLTSHQSCVLPRHKPQRHELDCQFIQH